MGHKPKDDNAITEETEMKNLTLHYLDASDSAGDSPHENDADFIKDIEQFKKDLPLITVPKVELTQC